MIWYLSVPPFQAGVAKNQYWFAIGSLTLRDLGRNIVQNKHFRELKWECGKIHRLKDQLKLKFPFLCIFCVRFRYKQCISDKDVSQSLKPIYFKRAYISFLILFLELQLNLSEFWIVITLEQVKINKKQKYQNKIAGRLIVVVKEGLAYHWIFR